MSTEEILEKLKTLTLLEATELVSQIEKTFDVDASGSRGGVSIIPRVRTIAGDVREEKDTFDVVLESIDRDKRVATLKVIRTLTNLGLKEAKEFCSALPKVVREGLTKDAAEIAKVELENAGSQVKIR
jgi:large subunit ribosomal protein L7/L12